MGLNASVRCNCIKEGKALPHPFPELLSFDETGEPTLRKEGQIGRDLWAGHDEWYRNSCSHSDRLLDRRLGNISLVAHVREFLQSNSPKDFPLLLERIVYSGSHCGDWIATADAAQLLTEARRLQDLTSDPLICQFTNDVAALAEASLATGNPIVF